MVGLPRLRKFPSKNEVTYQRLIQTLFSIVIEEALDSLELL